MFHALNLVHIKNVASYPRFLWDTATVYSTLDTTPGLLKFRVKMRHNPMTILQISSWRTKEEMDAFKRSPKHVAAMQDVGSFSDYGKVCVWESDKLPSWAEAEKHLDTEGRLLHFHAPHNHPFKAVQHA